MSHKIESNEKYEEFSFRLENINCGDCFWIANQFAVSAFEKVDLLRVKTFIIATLINVFITVPFCRIGGANKYNKAKSLYIVYKGKGNQIPFPFPF